MHARITELLCELSAFNIMQLLHEIQEARPTTLKQISTRPRLIFWTQVELVGPRATRLSGQIKVSVGDARRVGDS